MAVNSERNMRADLELGIREGSYMRLMPMWGGHAVPETERLTWPTYAQVERHDDCHCYTEITPREGPQGPVDRSGQMTKPTHL